MSHIFGIGVGLFMIIAVWTTAIFLCIVALRTHKDIIVLLFIKAAIVTVVLIYVPREPEIPTLPVFKLYDHLFAWRPILLTLLGLSSIAGFAFFLLVHLMEPRQAQPLKQWKL